MYELKLILKSGVLFLFALFLFIPSSQAGAGGACRADFEKFCSNVPKGKGERWKCLNAHQSQLSATCQAKIQEKKARREAIKRDCKADRERFCKNVERGQGRIRQCMKSHQNELSQACQAHFYPKTS